MKNFNNIDDVFIKKLVDVVFKCPYPTNNKFIVCITNNALNIINKKFNGFYITNNCIKFGCNYCRFILYNSTNPINISLDSKWDWYLTKNNDADYIEFCKKYNNL